MSRTYRRKNSIIPVTDLLEGWEEHSIGVTTSIEKQIKNINKYMSDSYKTYSSNSFRKRRNAKKVRQHYCKEIKKDYSEINHISISKIDPWWNSD